MKISAKCDTSPASLVQFQTIGGAFRIRQLDARNTVIEKQNRRGLWIIQGYHTHTNSLAAALLQLSAQLPDAEARDLTAAVHDLRAALDANAVRIIDALAAVEVL